MTNSFFPFFLLLFILLAHRYLEGREVNLGDLKGLDARKALMMVGIMTLHSFAEGVGVGVASALMHHSVFRWQTVGAADPIPNDQALTARRDGHDITI